MSRFETMVRTEPDCYSQAPRSDWILLDAATKNHPPTQRTIQPVELSEPKILLLVLKLLATP